MSGLYRRERIEVRVGISPAAKKIKPNLLFIFLSKPSPCPLPCGKGEGF